MAYTIDRIPIPSLCVPYSEHPETEEFDDLFERISNQPPDNQCQLRNLDLQALLNTPRPNVDNFCHNLGDNTQFTNHEQRGMGNQIENTRVEKELHQKGRFNILEGRYGTTKIKPKKATKAFIDRLSNPIHSHSATLMALPIEVRKKRQQSENNCHRKVSNINSQTTKASKVKKEDNRKGSYVGRKDTLIRNRRKKNVAVRSVKSDTSSYHRLSASKVHRKQKLLDLSNVNLLDSNKAPEKYRNVQAVENPVFLTQFVLEDNSSSCEDKNSNIEIKRNKNCGVFLTEIDDEIPKETHNVEDSKINLTAPRRRKKSTRSVSYVKIVKNKKNSSTLRRRKEIEDKNTHSSEIKSRLSCRPDGDLRKPRNRKTTESEQQNKLGKKKAPKTLSVSRQLLKKKISIVKKKASVCNPHISRNEVKYAWEDNEGTKSDKIKMVDIQIEEKRKDYLKRKKTVLPEIKKSNSANAYQRPKRIFKSRRAISPLI